tara:strand:+ start:327 stop:551 length:225 start_codon:yes stop_codon:yes gene_type:complete
MLPVEPIISVLFIYISAGFVKGVVVVNLQTISLAMLAIVLGLKEAIFIVLAPSLITNLVYLLVTSQSAQFCMTL